MKLLIVCRHLPEREGTATGRVLRATADGLVALGNDVTVLSWRPEPPTEELPPYARWQPLPDEPPWRTRGRALVRPRWDASLLGLDTDGFEAVLAEEQVSWAAVAGAHGAALVLHHLVALDAAALRRRDPQVVQDLRHERRATRRSSRVLTLSERVAVRVPGAVHVPVAVAPMAALPLVEEPVAALLADWTWPANKAALDVLLRAWPEVRARVPGARLLLAGRGDPQVGVMAGVAVVGAVARSEDVLSRAAVLAFPSPPTSGPKVKVLEALASGVPVVTTPAGAEGVVDAAAGAAIADEPGFADALAAALADPESRALRAAAGRDLLARHHAPEAAAAARLRALGFDAGS